MKPIRGASFWIPAILAGAILLLIYAKNRHHEAEAALQVPLRTQGIDPSSPGATPQSPQTETQTESADALRREFVRRCSVVYGLVTPASDDDHWRNDSGWMATLGETAVVVPMLIDVLRDNRLDNRIRAVSLKAITHYDAPEAKRLATVSVRGLDSDLGTEEVLLASVQILVSLKAVDTLPYLEALLRNPATPRAVRVEIARAIPELDLGGAELVLGLALTDSQMRDLLDVVLKGLAEIGSYTGARTVLTRYLAIPDIAAVHDDAQRAELLLLLDGLRLFPNDVLRQLMSEHLSMISPNSLADRNRMVMLIGDLRSSLDSDSLIAIGKAFFEAGPSPQLQSQSAYLLAGANNKAAADLLLDILAGNKEPGMCAVLISAISRIETSNVDAIRLKGMLNELMASPHSEVSTKAADCLAGRREWLAEDPELLAKVTQFAQRQLDSQDPSQRTRGARLLLELTPCMPQGETRLVELFPTLSKTSETLMKTALNAIGEMEGRSPQVRTLAREILGDPAIKESLRIRLGSRMSGSDYLGIKEVIVGQMLKCTDPSTLSNWAGIVRRHDPQAEKTLKSILESDIPKDAKAILEIELKNLSLEKHIRDSK